MARATLGVGVPLGAGLITGATVPGVLVAVGGLVGAVSDRPGPYPLRVRGIALAGMGGALGLSLGIAIQRTGWLAVAVLVLLAGASALLSSLSAGWSLTALCLLAMAVLGTGPLGDFQPRWLPVPLLLAGVCWSLLLLLPEWALQSRTVRLPEWTLRSRTMRLPEWELRPKAVRWPEPVLRSGAVRWPEWMRRSKAPPWRRSMAPSTALRLPGWAVRSRIVPWPGLVVRSRTLRLPGWVVRSGIVEPPQPRVATGSDAVAPALRGRGGLRRRLSAVVEEARLTFSAVSSLRLMLCVGVAAVLTEVYPLGRSYWVVLTVVVVVKPGLGSIFARAGQYAAGALLGAVVGALIIAAGPPEAVLLVPVVTLAALLPFGMSRNYALLVLFLTPLVILLIDGLDHSGWAIAESRLIDILLGCAIVLGIGYAPWPWTWHANLPRAFAKAVDSVADYLGSTLPTSTEASTADAQVRAHRRLDALRTEFRRAMAEPEPGRHRVLAWEPAADALERVLNAVTAIRTCAGEPPPAGEVAVLNDQLRHIAAAACSGRAAPQDLALSTSQTLEDVTDSIQRLAHTLGPEAVR